MATSVALLGGPITVAHAEEEFLTAAQLAKDEVRRTIPIQKRERLRTVLCKLRR